MSSPDSTVFIIRDEADLNHAYDFAEEFLKIHPEVEIEVSPYKPQRTVLQNRLLWHYYTEIGKQIGCTKNQMHLFYRNEFLGPKLVEVMGKCFNELPSTQDLNTKEMVEYITNIEIHAAENNLTLSAPAYRDDAIR